VEIATPNLSQNDGHHDKARFPAILEEEGRSDTSDSGDRVLKGDDHQSFNDHRWLQKGFLPRDTSSNTSKSSKASAPCLRVVLTVPSLAFNQF
jgi:hypothetical protein